MNNIDSTLSKTIKQLGNIDSLVKSLNINYPDIEVKYVDLNEKYSNLTITMKSVSSKIYDSNSDLKEDSASKLEENKRKIKRLESNVDEFLNKLSDKSYVINKIQKSMSLISSSLNQIEEKFTSKLNDVESKLDKSSKKIPKLDLKIDLLYHNDFDIDEIESNQSNLIKKLDTKLKEFRDNLKSIMPNVALSKKFSIKTIGKNTYGFINPKDESIRWNKDNINGITFYWSMNCDFNKQNFKSVKVVVSNCSLECVNTPDCTHFSWSSTNNGICFLKTGSSDTLRITDSSFTSVCGYINNE